MNRDDKKTEREKKFSFLKCIPKSNVIKKIWGVLVFSICIWYLAYPTDRSYDDVDTVLEIELNMYIIEEFAFSL